MPRKRYTSPQSMWYAMEERLEYLDVPVDYTLDWDVVSYAATGSIYVRVTLSHDEDEERERHVLVRIADHDPNLETYALTRVKEPDIYVSSVEDTAASAVRTIATALGIPARYRAWRVLYEHGSYATRDEALEAAVKPWRPKPEACVYRLRFK